MPTCSKTFWRATCWSIVILSALGLSADPADHAVPPPGTLAYGTSQQREATPAAGTPRLIALTDPTLASTAARREQLTYLVRCALPADVTVYTEQGTERFTFPGQMGLAPGWLSEAMTPSAERWVSACLLAYVNYWGKRVVVSTRATPPPVPALAASEDEQQTFALFEGGFFGNLFAPTPVAYTCQGERPPAQADDPVFQERLCTQESGTNTAEGQPLTWCRFVLTGRCAEASSFTVDGTPYAEVIFTYLRPSPR